MERADPWAQVGWFGDERLHAVLARASALLLANTGGGRRVTTGRSGPGSALWVYGRAGQPCRRCGAIIQGRRQGEQARTTYWCPSCQSSARGA
jgi:endonuclease-8